jgi:uncharacterized repeat protein (TIGR03803 family)
VRQLESRLTPSLTTLASFSGLDGENPVAPLIMDSGGNLYGTTAYGGTFGYTDHVAGDGTVFELAAGSGTITTLASFDGTDGQCPVGGPVLDGSGDLYGTTLGGGARGEGTVFELAKGSGTITTLASFNGGSNGGYPDAGLIIDGNGNLYGTTLVGGAQARGTVFEVAAGSDTITTLASFDGTDGQLPHSGLIMDGSGNLYGTTLLGGASKDGTVFEVVQGSGTITTLASFNGTDGANPEAALLMDGSGNLYGTTSVGGPHGGGTVFELAKGSGTITTLASPGSQAGLIMDASGNLYGTTQSGGAYGTGTAFELAAGSGTITTLASFRGSEGATPCAGLIMDASGNLFGTTQLGGANGYGTVFELPRAAAPDQWTGANFAVDTNWSDGANWSLGTPPSPGQTVVFNNANVHSLTSTVDAGFANAIGTLHIASTWGGTIAVNSPLSVTGNFSLASGNFVGTGAVTIGGDASHWTGGEIDLASGGFTNTGVLHINTDAANLVVSGAGTLTNEGTISEAGKNSLVLQNGATLSNAGRATFDLAGNGSVSQSGGGTFANAGTLEKSKGTGTSTIATTSLDNTGTVAVASGTLNVAATATQVSGHTLTAGTWVVTGSPTVHARLHITSAWRYTTLGSGAAVTLSGPNASFPNVLGLVMIDSGASFSLLGGASFTTVRPLRNKGSLALGPGSVLTVGGNFVQQPAGALTIELAGTDTAPTTGQLVSTSGTVMLAGTLDVVSTIVPAVGSSFEILDNQGNSAIGGTFKGLPEGSTFTVKNGMTTMTFQITYAGTDDDGNQNVILTRIA